ncbi:hypothetical protein MLD38_023846 [Melastoma candidum]|uniref:Uncharacterized protein n=1 Tax=Melastoma candidum TaxID=119954 RepID=A0ACB9NVF7_9MYRT|nr:hypothetical protein MLD38_023846 [Melastoma candidum]
MSTSAVAAPPAIGLFLIFKRLSNAKSMRLPLGPRSVPILGYLPFQGTISGASSLELVKAIVCDQDHNFLHRRLNLSLDMMT